MVTAAFSWARPAIDPAPFLVVAGVAAFLLESGRGSTASRGSSRRALVGGLVALLVALSWPLAALASSTSLAALVLQRELLSLVAAPLLLTALSPEAGARLTRPAPLDWLALRLSEPVVALVVTTVLFGLTAMPFAVSAASSSIWLRFLADLAVFSAGLVLWGPVVRRVPAVRELSPIGTAGYLLAQSIAPTFLSFAWILAPNPLYHSLTGQHAALGLSPLFDQRLSGYLAKLLTFGIIWPVAYRYFARAFDGKERPAATLHWGDVERHLERAGRQRRGAGAGELLAPPRGGAG